MVKKIFSRESGKPGWRLAVGLAQSTPTNDGRGCPQASLREVEISSFLHRISSSASPMTAFVYRDKAVDVGSNKP